MNIALSNKLLTGIALTLALLWTLGLAITYALLGFTGDFTHWLNDLFNVRPELAGWLAGAGAWVEQWGGWLLVVIWALGLLALALVALFARRLVHWFTQSHRQGGFA